MINYIWESGLNLTSDQSKKTIFPKKIPNLLQLFPFSVRRHFRAYETKAGNLKIAPKSSYQTGMEAGLTCPPPKFSEINYRLNSTEI
jgi:hypothetical protein